MLHIPGFLKFCEETTAKEMDNWKTTPRDNVFLKISRGSPIQDGWPTDPITAEMIPFWCGLAMFWLFFVIFLQQFLCWRCRNMFTEKSTCLLYLLIIPRVRPTPARAWTDLFPINIFLTWWTAKPCILYPIFNVHVKVSGKNRAQTKR